MERDASQQRGDKEIVRQLEAAFSFFLAQYEIKSHQRAELQLLQAKLLAAKLAEDEKTLHQSFPPSLKKVLEGKNLLVWKALLEKYGYDDLSVVRFMQEGVELVGMHDALHLVTLRC